jgi:SAM-dependent methyltransferase
MVLESVRRSAGELARCARCGLLTRVGLPSAATVSKFFRDEYYGPAPNPAREVQREPFAVWRARELRRLARDVETRRPTGGRILDIGCAHGQFLSNFTTSGNWSLVGVEPSVALAGGAARLPGAVIHATTFEDAPLTPASFDVISMLLLLPYIREPDQMLARVAGLLAPGGLALIELPGTHYGLLRYGLSNVPTRRRARLPNNHLRFYCEDHVRALVDRAGLHVVAVSTEEGPSFSRLGILRERAFRALASLVYHGSGVMLARRMIIWCETTCQKTANSPQQ